MHCSAARPQLIDKIAKELEIHSTIEEELFHPTVKGVRGGQGLVSEAKSEHKKVDSLVAESQGMRMESDEVGRKVKELRDAVVHHATEQMAARKKKLQTSRLQKAKRAVKKRCARPLEQEWRDANSPSRAGRG
jgi:hypothetical protein